MSPLQGRTAATTLLAAALAALPACGDVRREPEPLRVSARSGAKVDLSGTTWAVCLDATPTAGQSQRLRIVHGEDGVVTYGSQTFDAAGCTGNAGAPLSLSFIGFDEGERTVGWSGTPPAGAPESPVATKVLLEGAFAGAECFWLDDAAAPRLLYASADDSPANVDGVFPDLLRTTGYAEVR